MRQPGLTARDRKIAALEQQVRELQAALDIACADLEIGDEAAPDLDDPTPQEN